MDINNLTNVYNQNPSLQSQYSLQQYLDLFGGSTYTPPTTPTPTPDVPDQGIINSGINQFQNRGDGGRDGASDVDLTSFEEYRNPSASAYGPGGRLEMDPATIGMDFVTGNSRSRGGPFNMFSTPPKSMANFKNAGTGPSELGYMTKDIGIGSMNRDKIRKEYDNYDPFTGRNSRYGVADVKGPASELVNMIPYLGPIKRAFEGAGFKSRDNTSDRARYATDNGFGGGTGLQKDEFGVYTGGKTLFGKTADYQERIGNRIGELESFFTEKGIDLSDPDAMGKMKNINGFYTKQYFAYKNRQAIDKKRTDKIAKDKREQDARLMKEEEANRKIRKEKAANKAFQNAMNNQTAFYAGLNDGAGASSTKQGRDNAGGGAAANKGSAGSGWKNSPFARGGSVRKYFKGGIVSLRGR